MKKQFIFLLVFVSVISLSISACSEEYPRQAEATINPLLKEAAFEVCTDSIQDAYEETDKTQEMMDICTIKFDAYMNSGWPGPSGNKGGKLAMEIALKWLSIDSPDASLPDDHVYKIIKDHMIEKRLELEESGIILPQE